MQQRCCPVNERLRQRCFAMRCGALDESCVRPFELLMRSDGRGKALVLDNSVARGQDGIAQYR